MEATQTREKPASINARMRAMFAERPLCPMTARLIRKALKLAADTAITARVREIRNATRDPMDIRCERRDLPGGPLYFYRYYPADYVEPKDDDLPF